MSRDRTQPTHYQALGVPTTATPEQIKRAYRARAKTLHPDVSDAPDAAAKFTQIASAYEVLSDPIRRRTYDRSLLDARAKKTAKTADDEPSETGFRQGHYAWVNVAAPKSVATPPAEIDDLYDTFFSSRSGGASGAHKPSAVNEVSAERRASERRRTSAARSRVSNDAPESRSPETPKTPRPKATKKKAG